MKENEWLLPFLMVNNLLQSIWHVRILSKLRVMRRLSHLEHLYKKKAIEELLLLCEYSDFFWRVKKFSCNCQKHFSRQLLFSKTVNIAHLCNSHFFPFFFLITGLELLNWFIQYVFSLKNESNRFYISMISGLPM